jgi:DNA (cytosine-5)-methyltransferase 1
VNFLSVCSGIESVTVATAPLGWRAVAYAEIDKFASAVLKHHYPHTPNFGDMTKFHEWPDYTIDVLVGGTPCQSFSVAGLRKGLADPRGNLTLGFLGVVDRYRPRWILWENVPGVLSDKGNAFGQFLAGLARLGYGWAYRVLDAQFFGVPQRRRRVFVVGHLGNWQPAAAVLLEPSCLRWDTPPRREAGKRVTGTISARTKGGGGLGTDFDLDGGCVAHSLRADGFDASEDGTGRGTPLVTAPITGNPYGDHESRETILVPEVAWALQERDSKGADSKGADSSTKDGHLIPVAFDCKRGSEAGEVSPTLRSMTHDKTHQNGGGQVAVQHALSVRRLVPEECEKLQGFSPGYTKIPWAGRPAEKCPDGPRYKALGNSMAVPVIHWISRRIQIVHEGVPS